MKIGLPTILFVVFLVLKLTHNIDWSWVWVSSPLWISAILGIVVFTIFCVASTIVAVWRD